MIKGPRQLGQYPDRWIVFQQALEPVFLNLVAGYDTPFIDLAAIAGPIFDVGYQAGWSVSDIAAAVEELSVNRQLALGANRATDEAIGTTMTWTTRHWLPGSEAIPFADILPRSDTILGCTTDCGMV